MKKLIALILCLILSFTCVFALASCGECDEHVDKDGDNKCDECGEDYTAPVDGVARTLTCYSNSLPTKVVFVAKQEFFEVEDGQKFVVYDLDTETVLVTGKVNGVDATVETTMRETLRAVTEGKDILSAIAVQNTTREYLEGRGIRLDGADWNAAGANFAPTLGSIAIGIGNGNVTNVTYTEAPYNNVLTCTVPRDKIASVFGSKVTLTSDTDIQLTIVNDGAVITSLTLTYGVKASGNYPERKVSVVVNYDYNVQKVTLLG